MKRSEMIKIIDNVMNWPEGCSPVYLLEVLEEMGMLPPVSACTFVSDGNGGTKHSSVGHRWDKEDT